MRGAGGGCKILPTLQGEGQGGDGYCPAKVPIPLLASPLKGEENCLRNDPVQEVQERGGVDPQDEECDGGDGEAEPLGGAGGFNG